MIRFHAKGTLALVIILWLVAGFTIPALAQSAGIPKANPNAHKIAIDRGAAALWRSLRELHTRASLILFTAHPDDEDGGMLAYESRFVGADTTLFTLNRGEGGQNVMSPDFWGRLGLLRTEELLAADRYYGVHQYFSRVVDFGFSKTKEESLQQWGYDRVLYDAVRVVRMTRPLVVTSVFAGNASDGHGQHQVAGQMAQEVFRAAADPKVFPDQIRAGLRPWAPLKMYVRLPFATVTSKGIYDYATGGWAPDRFRNYIDHTWINGVPSASLKIPEGQYDAPLGLSYLQIGALGRNQQKSQFGGVGLPLPGPAFTGYHLYASRVTVSNGKENNFFSGIDTSLMGIADEAPPSDRGWLREKLQSINSLVEQAIGSFSIESPDKTAPFLAQGALATDALVREVQQRPMPEDARYNVLHELHTKQVQFNTALVQALGLSLDAVVSNGAPRHHGHLGGASNTFQAAIPGQKFKVSVHLADQGKDRVVLKQVRLVSAPDKDWKLSEQGSLSNELAPGQATDALFAVQVPDDATITKPYFTRPSVEQPYYDISDPRYLNLPLMPYPLSAKATFAYRGADVVLDQVVQTIHHVTGHGQVKNPMIVAPAVSVWVTPASRVLPLSERSLTVQALIRNNVDGPASGTVRLELPDGWVSEPAENHFLMRQDGDEETATFEVTPRALQTETYHVTVAASYEGKRYTSGSVQVGYAGLRPYPFYRDSSFKVTGVDVHVAPGLKVGYVMGTGDNVPAALKEIGVQTTPLSAQDIETGDLSQFQAIVLGVRVYAARPELKTFNSRLLHYVHDGGTLIVQYNTQEFDHDYGPYPYRLGGRGETVVDERSKVTILKPDAPAFSWPNKITARDFKGWIEERGHGFMKSWDPRYTALTETHDPGQAPQDGGLLVARYGKGFYVYDAFALYRQLPEAVPGAFRIFANLLSLSRNPDMGAQ